MQNLKSKTKTLLLKDKVFGSFKIDSPVIIELINSKTLQRLKKISLYGIPKEFYHLEDNPSRFLHSVQVMLLLKSLRASEEEQIAGLLHDISHTAFSHVIDWVVGDGKTENFQDDQHEAFLEKSEIFEILKKYKFDPKRISNHHNFTLLEQDIPDLCADRVGYSLREFPKKISNSCFKDLLNHNGKIVFRNRESAYFFAMNFLKRQMEHWGGFEAASRYRLFANVLKLALDKKIILFKDFWKDDEFVLKKLEKTKDKEIIKILTILRKKSLKNFPKSREVVYKKFRHVDPEFLENGKLLRLSKVDMKFKKYLEKSREINKKGITLPKI